MHGKQMRAVQMQDRHVRVDADGDGAARPGRGEHNDTLDSIQLTPLKELNGADDFYDTSLFDLVDLLKEYTLEEYVCVCVCVWNTCV
jgi:hypothetical protein